MGKLKKKYFFASSKFTTEVDDEIHIFFSILSKNNIFCITVYFILLLRDLLDMELLHARWR